MKKIVVCAVLGGIGNQMFQFAAAKALARIHSAELCLDLRGFERYALHNGYELGRVFGVDIGEATSEQLRADLGLFTTPLALKLLKRPMFSALRPKGLAIEPTFQYWEGLREMALPLYMMGYWQSDKYFSEIAPSIRDTFRFRPPLSALNSDIAEEIRSCSSVAIHVRRGDYVSHKKTSQIMSLCSMDYYNRAIRHIEASVEKPIFYIFSDDPDWAATNFAFLDRKTVISHNESDSSYVDMQLMSCCKHQIIANSTFSWWGAWLNEYPKKQVLAPARWFAAQSEPEDIYPKSWLVL
jgi:hypothetical protein